MEKKKQVFYVEAFVDGASPIFQEDKIIEIDIDDINALALLAIRFEPLPAITPANGYLEALHNYMFNNRQDPLYDCYYKVIYDTEGSYFLLLTTALTLLEQNHRENGINNKNMIIFNDTQKEYKKALDYNADRKINNLKY